MPADRLPHSTEAYFGAPDPLLAAEVFVQSFSILQYLEIELQGKPWLLKLLANLCHDQQRFHAVLNPVAGGIQRRL